MSSNIKHPITGEWVSYDAYRREQLAQLAALDGMSRSDMVAPQVIRDDLGMRGIVNHVDGRRYDSRSAYLAAVQEAGRREGKQYEVVGNDPAFERPPKREYQPVGLKEDIKAAYDRVAGT